MPVVPGVGTVGGLVDRVYRDFLHPADDQPIVTTLNGALTNSATSVVYDDDTLAAEEESLLGPGVLVEVGRELMLVTAVDDGTNTLTVVRGRNGTDAVAHDDAATLTVAPTWPRQVVFDAVGDTVVGLFPSLYSVKTTALTLPLRTDADPITEAPGALIEPLHFTYTSGAQVRQADHVKWFQNLDATITASGVGVDAPGVAAGTSGWLTYRARFDRPTLESDDLADLGVESGWERMIVVGAAAQLLGARDVEQATYEFVTESLERQGFPVGSGSRVRDSLIRYYEYLLDQAKQSLWARTEPVVTYNSLSWQGM